MDSKRFGCWDFVILIFSIFSLALVPLQMLHKGREDILMIIDSADILLCSFFFADFLKDLVLIGHKDKVFWKEADSMRFLIPKNSRQTKRLERLLILRYNPVYNDPPGRKSSAADDCLELIENELTELFE